MKPNDTMKTKYDAAIVRRIKNATRPEIMIRMKVKMKKCILGADLRSGSP